MSESFNNGESINENSQESRSSSSLAENEESNDGIQIADENERPINSYASMIYFKDKSQKYSIKEEPSSPEDSWKSDNNESELKENEDKEPSREEENTYNKKSSSTPRTATVTPIRSTAHSYVYNSPLGGNVDKPRQQTTTVQGTPRKPLTPYMSYRNMIFEEIKHKYPGCTPYDLACLISSKWSMLTDSERKVWEDQYEEEMKNYNEALLHYPVDSKIAKVDYNNDKKLSVPDTQSPAQVVKGVTASSDNGKSTTQFSACKWCRRCTYLQDFSSIIDGREMYCTGLCSEKCFAEAAKQINSIEGGISKPRYIRSSNPQEMTSLSTSIRQSPSTTPSYATANMVDPRSKVFDWEQYLTMDTQSSSAHWTYFKQARYPPTNSFAIGMKLEACSYNAVNVSPTFSLATVIATCGARILLHFDGADPSSDIWRLPDSGDIHPVGWTEGSLLKAPFGYKYDPSKYNKYFASSLQSAEIAPARYFKKEPKIPMENYFTVGMKLESVDKTKPSVIGVASVVDVEGEQIKIEFDGYKGLGYWCHFYDRDLFPPGWCAATKHPIRPPGNKVSQILPRESHSSPPPTMASIGPKSPLLTPVQRETTSSTSSWKEKTSSPNSVEVFINGECYCGPYIELAKLKSLQRVYKGNMVTVLKDILEDVIRCAIDPKTVFGFLKPGRGNCVIKAICDGVAYQCCLNSIDRVSTFWRVLEQFSDNLRCCPNMFSSTESRLMCTRCNANRVRSLSTVHEYHRGVQHGKRHYGYQHGSYSTSTHNRSESYSRAEVPTRPEHLTSPHAYNTAYEYNIRRDSECESPSATGNSRKDSVFEPSGLVTPHGPLSADTRKENRESIKPETDYSDRNKDEDMADEEVNEPKAKKKKLSRRKVEDIDIMLPPKTWTIDEVASFIEQTDLKDYAANFRDNEIDGKALLLLQRDLVLSHMGFKLGPAVKLLDMIEELRLVQESFQ